MAYDLASAERIVVNSQHLDHLPAILIFFGDEVITISSTQIPAILAGIQLLEHNKYIRVLESTDRYTVFAPIGEEARDSPTCEKCGSICIPYEHGFRCLNCHHLQ